MGQETKAGVTILGGRGGGGGGPASPGNRKPGGAGISTPGSGGSGGGGSSGGSGKGQGSAGTGGIDGGGKGGSSGGGDIGKIGRDESIRPAKLSPEFGDNISEGRKIAAQRMIDEMPEEHLKLLERRGVRMFVDNRADQSPGWVEYATKEGINSNSKHADGRSIGDLSFYHKGVIFVSDGNHGSKQGNVYTHELSHAIDYHWLETTKIVEFEGKRYYVYQISDDPQFIDWHSNKVLDNPAVRAYFKTGSNNTVESGRRESFAEGYSQYLSGGMPALIKFFGTSDVADEFVDILKGYGVIK